MSGSAPSPCRDPGDASVFLSRLLEAAPIRAPGLIVTIYGDAVVPRGGVLWMGSLIAICERLGVSESLARTAVSRLVAAGRLEGERRGRRSYYRLAAGARDEFAAASRLFYGRERPAKGWLIRHGGAGYSHAPGEHEARLGPDTVIRPWRGEPVSGPGVTMLADTISGHDELPRWAAGNWDLSAATTAYRQMVGLFAPLERDGEDGSAEMEADALPLRLLLVHHYRRARLKDPRLPAEALPADWPGGEARALFARLYRRLSPLADRHVGECFENESGKLPRETDETRARLAELATDDGVQSRQGQDKGRG